MPDEPAMSSPSTGPASRPVRRPYIVAAIMLASFMIAIEATIVATAMPQIVRYIGGLRLYSWVFSSFLLTQSATTVLFGKLADLYGRKNVILVGIAIFLAGSIGCGFAWSMPSLIAFRLVQGLGAGAIQPVTMTVVGDLYPAHERGKVQGWLASVWGASSILGPLAGGLIIQHFSWTWIFWINVPVGLALIPVALRRLDESYGPSGRLDLPGVGLVSTGLLGIVWGLVRGNGQGWTSPEIVVALAGGAVVLAGFVLWELRAESPMLPMRFFRNRTFAMTNLASLLMFFGMFGSIFLLAQFFQTVQGYSPFGSGLRILPWTAMPIFVAPIAGALSDRIGGRRIIATGLALQAVGLGWIAAVSTPTTPYGELVAPFVLSGIGMALFFAPVANVVLSSVRPEEEGQASGANNAIRELGGVFGVAVLASVFARYGGYGTGASFVAGLTPAIWVGAVVVGSAAVAALAIPRRRRPAEIEVLRPVLDEAA
jgi:EmrB/QacA subfamily drug resistance transporter